MTIRTVLECDSCGATKAVDVAGRPGQSGWRTLPVRTNLGPDRNEQPLLCTDCLDLMARVIHFRRTSPANTVFQVLGGLPSE